MKDRWRVKDRYWVMLAITLSFSLFCYMKAGIINEHAMLKQALADAGDNLPYQLIIYDSFGTYVDTIYTNDYTLTSATDGKNGLNDLNIRWGVTWAGKQWQFISQPETIEDVRVTVNTGESVKIP